MSRPASAVRAPKASPGGSEPIFFDTNVLVYAYASRDARRRRALDVVEQAMQAHRFVISAQVMQEFYDVVVRRRFLSPDIAIGVLRLLAEYPVVTANADSVLRALALQQRYRISVWDALVVQSALDANCATLFSEDLQDGQRFAGVDESAPALTVINPFAPGLPQSGPSVHEPQRSYAVALHQAKSAPRRSRP